jgi:importin subunit beta-1
VCDEEIVLIDEEQEATAKGGVPENKCYYFMKNALVPFMPLILSALTKQSEEVDDDTMNMAMAAGTCLGLIAQCTQDDVVDQVLPFVQQNINSENWRLKEAATLAFGYILDGPAREKLEPLVGQAFLLILHHLKDPSALVKDTAAWTIGRICSLVPGCINADTLDPLLQSLHGSLKDVPKVSANVCWAIHNLASALDLEDGVTTSPISGYFEGLIRELLATTDRPDANEGNLLCSAWEAINVLIHTAAPDVYPLVGQLVPLFLEKLGQTLNVSGLTGEDREKQNEVQGLLCGALQVIIQKLDESVVKPHADDMMRLFLQVLFYARLSPSLTAFLMAIVVLSRLSLITLPFLLPLLSSRITILPPVGRSRAPTYPLSSHRAQVLHSKTATVHEEALHGIGAIASRVGPEFEKYVNAFR